MDHSPIAHRTRARTRTASGCGDGATERNQAPCKQPAQTKEDRPKRPLGPPGNESTSKRPKLEHPEPVCADCGAARVPLTACVRSSWPSPPNPPPWTPDVAEEVHKAQLRAEKARRAEAPRVLVCKAPSLSVCVACASIRGCSSCGKWECATCFDDKATIETFKVYHDDFDPDVDEDEYGRRGGSPHFALALKPCYGCDKAQDCN